MANVYIDNPCGDLIDSYASSGSVTLKCRKCGFSYTFPVEKDGYAPGTSALELNRIFENHKKMEVKNG